MSPKMRAKALRDIEILEEFGMNLCEPYVKPIKGEMNKGLYELRIQFAGDIARIFYFTYEKDILVLLHGFVKKTMKTPAREIEKAVEYMTDYRRRNDDE